MAFAGTDAGAEETTEYVVAIGDKGYETLDEALSASEAGDTVKLLGDVDCSAAKCFDIEKR